MESIFNFISLYTIIQIVGIVLILIGVISLLITRDKANALIAVGGLLLAIFPFSSVFDQNDQSSNTGTSHYISGDYEVEQEGNKVKIIKYFGNEEMHIIPKKLNNFTVTAIADYAFHNNHVIKVIEIPDSVVSIEKNAFSYCMSLSEIKVSNGNRSYSDYDGCLYNYDQKVLMRVPAGKKVAVNIPKETKLIVPTAFSFCYDIEEIIVDNNNADICDYSGAVYSKDFYSLIVCPPGKKGVFLLHDYCRIIEDAAFLHCKYLYEIILSENLSIICEQAFWYCDSITSMTIPESVRSIDRLAFGGCHNMESIFFEGDAPNVVNNIFGDIGGSYIESLAVYYKDGRAGWSEVFCDKETSIY